MLSLIKKKCIMIMKIIVKKNIISRLLFETYLNKMYLIFIYY